MEAEKIKIANMFFTPLAILLILLSIYQVSPETNTLIFSILLVVLGALFNELTAIMVTRNPLSANLFGNLRFIVNILINSLLIYILRGLHTPLWLLLFLSPLVAAIYSSLLKTFTVCIFSVLMYILLSALLKSVIYTEIIGKSIFMIVVPVALNILAKRGGEYGQSGN